MQTLLLFLPMIALCGMGLFIGQRLQCNFAFLPIVTVSSLTVCLFVAGLLNVLLQGVVIATALGILAFIWYVYQGIKGKFCAEQYRTPGILFFLLLCAYFFVLFSGVKLVHYDNFSHWATMVKEMDYFNAYPDFRSIITFTNYPPGTATFVYFFIKLTGFSESYALMAQGVLIAAALSALFCSCSFKKWTATAAVTGLCVMMLCVMAYDDGTLNLYNLLVDGVLGYVSVAAMIMAYYRPNEEKTAFFSLAPVLVMLVLIKDSAKLFFAVALAVFVLATYLRSKKAQRPFWGKTIFNPGFLGIALLPLIANVLWTAHVKAAFPTAQLSQNKFVLTPAKLANTLFSHTDQFWNEFPKNFFHGIFDFTRVNTKVFLASNLLLILVCIALFLTKNSAATLVRITLALNGMMVAYLVNLSLLYLFVMEEGEAITVSAFDRYYATAMIVFVGIGLFAALRSIQKSQLAPSTVTWAAFGVGLCLCFVGVGQNLQSFYTRPDPGAYRRQRIAPVCALGRQSIGRDQQVGLFGVNQDPSGYYWYLLKYEMSTSSPHVITTAQQMLEKITQLDYLLVLEQSPLPWDTLLENGCGVVGSKQALVYQIQKQDDGGLLLLAKA